MLARDNFRSADRSPQGRPSLGGRYSGPPKIEPDLFGGFLLLKQWGRIGTDGCKIAHRYNTEALAICDGRLRLRPGAGMLKRSEEVPAALAGLHDTLLAAAASGIVHLRLKHESKC